MRDSKMSRRGAPVIVEKDVKSGWHYLISPVGSFDSTASESFTYFFRYPDGTTRPIAFLTSHRVGYGLDIYSVDSENCWLAIDVTRVGTVEQQGEARVVLFDEQSKMDECFIKFDYVDSFWTVRLSVGTHAFSYIDRGVHKQVLIDGKRLKQKEPNQSLEPTTMLGTSAAKQPLVPSMVVAHL